MSPPTRVAICRECGRERACYVAASEQAICHTCRWRDWQPPVDRCTCCQRERPCHHAGTPRAICPSCQATRPERHEPCIGCGQRRRVARRTGPYAECNACVKRRKRARVACPDCGKTLRPAATDPARCERCAGEKPLPECRDCGTQADHHDAGRCPRCALSRRLEQLRSDGDPTALTILEPFIAALAASPDPWTVICWMRESPAYRTVQDLAGGRTELSHEALDAVRRGKTTAHLRAALVAHGVLAPRAEQTASLDRATERALARLPDTEDRAHVRAFAAWQLRHHLQQRERRGQTTRSSGRFQAQRMRAAVELVLWAHSRGLTLKTLDQLAFDRWLTEGSTATIRIAPFLRWATRGGLLAPLALPPSQSRRRTLQVPEDERIATIRRLLHDESLDLRDRVAGSLVLLFGQPLTRIVTLRTSDVHVTGQSVAIRLGREPLALPQPLGQLVVELARERPGKAKTAIDPETRWLFPGMRLDAPLSDEHLRRRLKRIGITAWPARTAALATLARTLPPAIIADLLGFTEAAAAEWSALAGGQWARYAAHAATRYQNAQPTAPQGRHNDHGGPARAAKAPQRL